MDLPLAMYHHNLVRVGDSGRYVLYGGFPEGDSLGRTWVIDLEEEEPEWVEREANGHPRCCACAGFVRGPEGEEWVRSCLFLLLSLLLYFLLLLLLSSSLSLFFVAVAVVIVIVVIAVAAAVAPIDHFSSFAGGAGGRIRRRKLHRLHRHL